MNDSVAVGTEARVRWMESEEEMAHSTRSASWKIERQTAATYIYVAGSALKYRLGLGSRKVFTPISIFVKHCAQLSCHFYTVAVFEAEELG